VGYNTDGAVSGFNRDVVIVKSYNTAAPFAKSYPVSATHNQFSATYKSLPAYPSIYHTRLEVDSTQTTTASSFSATAPDLGHYPNAWVDTNLSNAWNVIGAFAPPSSVAKGCYLYDSAGAFIASAVLSGMYNQNGVVDKNGYVSVSQTSGLDGQLGADGQGYALSAGPVIFSSVVSGVHPSAGNTAIAVVPQHSDSVTLAAYGGVNHIGVYCLDLPAMLASGITPPYSYDALNNNRIYKLVSKVSFWNNLLDHVDVSTLSGLFAGLGAATLSTNKGPTFVLKFNFL